MKAYPAVMEVKGYGTTVSFDGHNVIVAKKGRSTQIIPLSTLNAVSIENAGLGMRAIRFSVAGGSVARPSVFLGKHSDYATDPFATTFKKKRLAEFEEFAAVVLAAKA